MERRLVVFRERDGHAALRILRVGFARAFLREHDDARARRSDFERGAKSGDAAADHDEVCFKKHLICGKC
jgi:hypothetical protein